MEHKRKRKTMKEKYILIVLVILIMGIAAIAQEYEPPEIIGVLTDPYDEDHTNFAPSFCWIGDRNQDGFDDLAASHARFYVDSTNRVHIFHGGEEMVDQPVITLQQHDQSRELRAQIVYIGDVFNDRSGILCVRTQIPDMVYGINFYDLTSQDVDSPVMSVLSAEEYYVPMMFEYCRYPFDFNGDNISDFLYYRPYIGTQISFGGADFDTIPDWSIYAHFWGTATGYDVNNDGYDDIIERTRHTDERADYYSLFLGGDPPDTNAIYSECLDDYNLKRSFCMLPDVNGDGFDEWGAYWYTPEPMRDGFYVFLGDEHPDGEPDIRLQGSPDRWLDSGSICGGDFNGDGFGDIVTVTGGPVDHDEGGDLMIFFGNPYITPRDEIFEPDIIIDLTRSYNGLYPHSGGELGAVGDYNGDGIDDFVWHSEMQDLLVIFAGNQEWQLNVPETGGLPLFPHSIELSAYPNPFNTSINIEFQVVRSSYINLSIFNIRGQMVKHIFSGEKLAGEYTATVSNLRSGIYFSVLQSDETRIARKIVCIQ